MSFIELTVKGQTAYLRACIVSGVLPDESRKVGCVVYCDPPIEALAVDETVEEVYAMLYVEDEDEDEDEVEETVIPDEDEAEDYEVTDEYVTDMMAAWNIKMGSQYLVAEEEELVQGKPFGEVT